MEFVIEFILELIIEGTIEIGTSRKVALPIRIMALLLFLAIYGVVLGAIAMVGIGIWQDGNMPLAIFVFGIDAFIAIVVVYWIVKQYKEKQKKIQ